MLSLLSQPVTFKEVWTTNTRELYVNPYWSITQFVQTVRPILAREFECADFDIVETGQDAPGIPAEAGRALELSNISLINKWGKDLRVGFYIRRRDRVYRQLENLNQMDASLQNEMNPIISSSFATNQCPICFESVLTLTRYMCRHSICNNCYHHCLQTDYHICPVCRSQ
jgi:hypothetical protein